MSESRELLKIYSIKKEIKKCFSKVASFSESEINTALELISIQSYKKGGHILKEGGFR